MNTTSSKTRQEVAREYLDRLKKVRNQKKRFAIIDDWHFSTRTKNIKDEKREIISKEIGHEKQ